MKKEIIIVPAVKGNFETQILPPVWRLVKNCGKLARDKTGREMPSTCNVYNETEKVGTTSTWSNSEAFPRGSRGRD